MNRVRIGILLVFLVYGITASDRIPADQYNACHPIFDSKYISTIEEFQGIGWRPSFDVMYKKLRYYKNVKILKIQRNRIEKLCQIDDNGKYSYCLLCLHPQLKELDLSTNNLKDLTSMPFKFLLKLEILDLSDNKISSIGNDVFSRTKKLRKLNLKYNKLTSVSSHYFGNIPEMTWLNLRFNSISKLDDNSFNGMMKLKSLLLRGNKLESYNDACTGTKSGKRNRLSYIDLGRNELKTFPNRIHYGMADDSKLDLDDNKITRLTQADMHYAFVKAISKKIIVDLTGNDFCITSAAISSADLEEHPREQVLATCIKYKKKDGNYRYPDYLRSCECDD